MNDQAAGSADYTVFIEEYKQKLKISTDDLDAEVEQQPSTYYEVASRQALAVSKRDALYERIKVVDSELGLLVRKEAEAEGRKLTEAMVASLVQTHEDHMHVKSQYLMMKQQAEELSALKESFMQRAHMLRDVVQLYLNGYNADRFVRSTNYSRESYQAKADALREKVRQGRRQEEL